jgi:transcriptional regulator with XRE-family HTH domain
MTKLGDRLKEERKLRGWTQKQLGVISKLNTLQISHFECNVHVPSIANAIKLCDALECSMDWLTRGIKNQLDNH